MVVSLEGGERLVAVGAHEDLEDLVVGREVAALREHASHVPGGEIGLDVGEPVEGELGALEALGRERDVSELWRGGRRWSGRGDGGGDRERGAGRRRGGLRGQGRGVSPARGQERGCEGEERDGGGRVRRGHPPRLHGLLQLAVLELRSAEELAVDLAAHGDLGLLLDLVESGPSCLV